MRPPEPFGRSRRQQHRPRCNSPSGWSSRLVHVPTSKVGYLVGYGGRTIKGFERRSGCHISIVDPNSRRAETRVRIQGPNNHIGHVVRLLMELYGCETLSSSLRFPSNSPQIATERRLFSNEFVDTYLIVRRGFRVRAIEQETSAKIAIFRDEELEMAPIDVTGTAEALIKAWLMLDARLAEFRRLSRLTHFMDQAGLLDESCDFFNKHNDNRARIWTIDKIDNLEPLFGQDFDLDQYDHPDVNERHLV